MDPLNRVVSPVGERLQKQKEAIRVLEARLTRIKTFINDPDTYDGRDFEDVLRYIEATVDGETDDED